MKKLFYVLAGIGFVNYY